MYGKRNSKWRIYTDIIALCAIQNPKNFVKSYDDHIHILAL
jgi:hypothetical protein